MVSNALPRMHWALAGAKRLECGSLLPLCFYAQPTCLEPDRNEAANKVSVPISSREKFPTGLARMFHTLSSLRNGCLQATKEYAGSGKPAPNQTSSDIFCSVSGVGLPKPAPEVGTV